MAVSIHIPTQIIKRSGETVEFNKEKIFRALVKCFSNLYNYNDFEKLNEYTKRVVNVLSTMDEIPTVEKVQDIVVLVLQSSGEYEAAQEYIIYRHERTKAREAEYIQPEIIDLFEQDRQYFPTQLQRFQYYDKYSRFNYDLGRRETWRETVGRTRDFLRYLIVNNSSKNNSTMSGDLRESVLREIEEGILNLRVVPSMRLLAMAGPAAERDNAVIYNCSYLPIDSIESFCELMSNSMAGCGVGFSVESYNTDKLPIIENNNFLNVETYYIKDSAEGWTDALRVGLQHWYNGTDISFNYDNIRPKGTPLKIKGGRASGKEPLQWMLQFIRNRILARRGKKLTTLDCHDIACTIGNAVVSGGVRRTALISIYDADDALMATCKSGDFEKNNNQRWNANNSAVWLDVPIMTQKEFLGRMWTMFESERGEPGIFARENAHELMPSRRSYGQEDVRWGTNPCGEIILRPYQFCNLSAVVARHDDTEESLKAKVRLATIIGTIQSTATYFPHLRPIWAQNCEEERLLGVDITGQLDCPVLLNKPQLFKELRALAKNVNAEFAELLGINASKAITTVKPSGNSSVLLDCSSGLHSRWAQYYIRNVRLSATSPLVKVLQDSGIKLSPENGQDAENPNTWVVSFPVKSPENAILREGWGVINQCEWWLINKLSWTEHNPSVTIYYSDKEILELLNWLWEHKEYIGGMSFLPKSDAKYDQLPNIEISKEEYEERISVFNDIKFERIVLYEKTDHSTASQEAACEGPICELPLP